MSVLLSFIRIMAAGAMSTNLKILIKNYLEPDGLIDTKYDPTISSIGNSVYRSVYYALLAVRGELLMPDKQDCLLSINMSRVPGVPGLFYRSSFKKEELQGHDDIIGICTESYFVDDGKIAREVLTHGKSTWYSYNTLEPLKFSWRTMFARHPLFVAHVYMCAGIRPPIYWRMYWCLGLFLSALAPTTNATAWYLAWLSVVVGERQGLFARMVAKCWRLALRLRTKEGMKDIMRNCCEDGHPLIEYMV